MNKSRSEFGNFDEVMSCLLSVPYSELQKKLEEEKGRESKPEREAGYIFFASLPF
jgi:hypothetical protein